MCLQPSRYKIITVTINVAVLCQSVICITFHRTKPMELRPTVFNQYLIIVRESSADLRRTSAMERMAELFASIGIDIGESHIINTESSIGNTNSNTNF